MPNILERSVQNKLMGRRRTSHVSSAFTRIDSSRFGPWAIVTGSSSGIGAAFARHVAASGLNVVLLARRGALLEELGEQLRREFGIQYRAVVADLTHGDFLTPIR